MPQTKATRGQVLSWDEVHGRFTDEARAMPAADVERQLEAMGYNLDKIGNAIGKLNALPQRPVNTAASALAVSAPAPAASASKPQRRWWHAPLSWAVQARSAAAGALAVALVAVLAVPVSQTVIGHWLNPTFPKFQHAARSASSVEEQVQQLIQSVKVAVDPLGFARNLHKAGRLLEDADRTSDAVHRYFEAIVLFEDHTDKFKPSPMIATIAHNLARLLTTENRMEEAELLLERALEINLMHFGPDHPIVARDLQSLNALHRARNLCTKPSQSCTI